MRDRGRIGPKPHRQPKPGQAYWAEIRQTLYGRANGRCEWGGCDLNSTGMEAHHRKLRSQGGGHGVTNLVALCPAHHSWIHDHPVEARARGFIVERFHDPAMVALLLWDRRTVRLDRDGSYDVVFDDSPAGEPA